MNDYVSLYGSSLEPLGLRLSIPQLFTTLAPQIREAPEGLRSHGWDGHTAARLVIFGGDGYLR